MWDKESLTLSDDGGDLNGGVVKEKVRASLLAMPALYLCVKLGFLQQHHLQFFVQIYSLLD